MLEGCVLNAIAGAWHMHKIVLNIHVHVGTGSQPLSRVHACHGAGNRLQILQDTPLQHMIF